MVIKEGEKKRKEKEKKNRKKELSQMSETSTKHAINYSTSAINKRAKTYKKIIYGYLNSFITGICLCDVT